MILSLDLKELSYDIVIEKGCLFKASTYLNLNRKVLIITDSGVPSNYANIIKNQCLEGYIYTFTQGEAEKVKLSWKQIGSDYPMQPYHLSDGSIRFICLATALPQPNPPSTIIIDEPELGLHPEAIGVLAELIKLAAQKTQVIVATQSPLLLDQFSIEDIIVARRKDGASTFERLKEEDYTSWLEDYTVGELWTKNVIQGGTSHE